MRKIITTLLLFFLVIFSTVAQNVIKGVVVDSEENNQLKGVAINVKESTVSTLTNENGVFILQNLSNGSYVLEISYKGYETQNFPVELTGNTIDLGTILLYEDLTEEEDLSTVTLTDDELKSFNANTKVLPPLRTVKDTKALIKGLKEGVIDMVTSDHNPIDIEHKKVEYYNAKFGTIGLESLFGTVNSVLDIETTIKALTINPRAIFGQESITIEKDTVANLTLFNPEGISVFSKENILSTSKNSAFTGKELKGKVYGIFANKKLVLN